MSTETTEAPKKKRRSSEVAESTPETKKARRPRSEVPPAYTQILDATDEEIDAAFNAVRHRSDFSKFLDSLEVGKGKKIEGDFLRLRSSVNVFQKKHGKHFLIAKGLENGFVMIKRIQPEQPAQPAAPESAESESV